MSDWYERARRQDGHRRDRGFGPPDLDRNPVADQQRDFPEKVWDRRDDLDWSYDLGRGPAARERREAAYARAYDRYARPGAGDPERLNPALQRVSDGDADEGWRDTLRRRPGGGGPHAGRGPKGYVRADARIRDDVSEELAEDSWLDASDIEVEVSGGEVILNGTVLDHPDRRRAEALAARVHGVAQVQNNLRVRQAQS